MPLNRRTLILAGATGAALGLIPVLSQAGTDKVYSNRGIAVDGTDVVAYFKEGKPVSGSKSFTHDWNGATWRFSTEANRAAFAANPEAFAPQYGGFCAYAVSEGYTASTTPEAWKIVDGKLYLNYSRRVQRTWEEDIPGRIAAADRNWPGVLN